MPLVYPLGTADFLDIQPLKGLSIDLPEVSEVSQTAGGEIVQARIGNRLWQGELTYGRLQRPEKRAVRTLVTALRQAGGSFMVYDIEHPYPASDPDGALVSGFSPVIRALDTGDTRLLQLEDLPPAYRLARGDKLAFTYGASPTRFALHEVVDDAVVATATGFTDWFEVQPNIEPGASIGQAVQLSKPACKAIIVPGTVQPGRSNRFITDGMGFQFMQTLR